MLILGNVCASLSLIGFALTSALPLVLAVAVLEGTGEAAYAVSFVAMVADKAGNEKRTAAFSLLSFLGWVAGALGSFVISSEPGDFNQALQSRKWSGCTLLMGGGERDWHRLPDL